VVGPSLRLDVLAAGECGGDVFGADDFEAAGFGDVDVVVGEGGAEVVEGPVFVFGGVVLGEAGEDDLGADAVFAAHRIGDVGEVVDQGCFDCGLLSGGGQLSSGVA